MAGKRVYGDWASSSDVPENKTRCIAAVWQGFHSGQCRRKRGYGPNGEHCKQHAKMLDKKAVRDNDD